MVLWSIWLGCNPSSGPGEDPLARAIAPWPRAPDAILARCDEEPFEELAVTCRVTAAAAYGMRGDADAAQSVCEQIPAGTWRAECHFRAGEELGATGKTIAGLRQCAQAGRFGRNCLTHTAWRLPPDPALSPDLPAARIVAGWSELELQAASALRGAEPGVEREGLDVLLARYGYNLYVGRGSAAPAAARLDASGLQTAGDGIDWELAGSMRTAFAVEAARLLAARGIAPTVEGIVAIWKGEQPPPRAKAEDHFPLGRFMSPILSPYEAGQPHLPLFGGGLRLAAKDPEEDVTIAALEALYWVPQTDARVFLPWLNDPRERVRRTAAKLLRVSQSATLNVEETVKQILAEHTDKGVRWHMQDALDRRTFAPPPARPL
ncbi:MAG: hypothetical protein AAFV53_20535 [Myxococcota bacterium]